MGQDEGFLARWWRRKRLSAAAPHGATKRPAELQSTPSPSPQDPVIAPEALPPIESLDAASDIKPFLAPGVPLELARRALRRAWVSDSAIRDFIGLSENAWDFTAPDGVPGFGVLSAEDAARLLAKASEPAPSSECPPPAQHQSVTAPIGSAPGGAPPVPAGNGEIARGSRDPPEQSAAADAAAQQEEG